MRLGQRILRILPTLLWGGFLLFLVTDLWKSREHISWWWLILGGLVYLVLVLTFSLGTLSAGGGWKSVTRADPAPSKPPKRRGRIEKPAKPVPDVDPVQFLAVYPVVVPPEVGASIWAYVFTGLDRDEVTEDANLQSHGRGPQVHSAAEGEAGLERGVVLTATPRCAGLTFDPPAQSVVWRGRWRRFDFHAGVTGKPNSPVQVRGTISFSVEGLLVADIPFEAVIGKAPLTDSETQHVNGRLYDAIFPSYSHEDKQIVERLERAYRALGLSYLRDVTTLRSGKKWRPELQRLIERADAFQLFWSHSAARSENVTQEWRTAVQLIEDKKKAETFIRPVYWEQPMPPAPSPLKEINFAFEPDLRN